MPTIESIPTNVITGFLGTGKTTAILHLLDQKPSQERWAVLVNEFGEVGIDGDLLQGNLAEGSEVFIRQLPGGCMCCANGVPMQVALNTLLSQAKPHRLLIEPTGLGHPKEVIEVLSSSHYRQVLDLQNTVTLVDARKARDERYTNHATFKQQLAIADVIVANKADQYQPDDFPELLGYLETSVGLDSKPVYKVCNGALQLDWLEAPAQQYKSKISQKIDQHTHHSHSHTLPLPPNPAIPDSGYLMIENEGEGFYSKGWIFTPQWQFDADLLSSLLLGVESERIKGVFKTNRGIIHYNKADNVLKEGYLDHCTDSRIECIGSDKNTLDALEDSLLNCVIER